MRTLGGVASARELRAAGVSSHALRWAVRKGDVTAVRRGVYAVTESWNRAGPQRRHLLLLLAHQRIAPDLVASSVSAAVVLGLPTPTGPPPEPVFTTVRRGAASGALGRRGGRLTRRARLGEEEIWSLRNGLRLTSPQRTVLDCAREWSRPWGLAIADAALRHRTVTGEGLLAAARRRAGMPGGRNALWAAQHTRAAVESPLESLARAHIVLAGCPEPTPQVWLGTRSGNFRVDLLDRGHRLVTEADGRLKYQHPDDLWEKKRREEALRERGYAVIRFTMRDAEAPEEWQAAYRALLRLRR